MRKPRRAGTDSGHKKDFLVRQERSHFAAEPGAIQTGGSSQEAPYRRRDPYGGGRRTSGVKKRPRKGMRRGERMEDHALAQGAQLRWHPR